MLLLIALLQRGGSAKSHPHLAGLFTLKAPRKRPFDNNRRAKLLILFKLTKHRRAFSESRYCFLLTKPLPDVFTPYSFIGVSCVHTIHADHVLRIVIAYLAKIAKLPVDGLLRRKKIAYLEILTLTGTLGHKINLAVLQLTRRHFIPTLTKMQKHHIFKQFLYVAQQIYSHKTVAQTKIIEILVGGCLG